MNTISIISSSVRIERKSHNVALYLQKYLTEKKLAKATILDLKEFNFPIFDERFSKTEKPTKEVVSFRDEIIKSDGVIIVTPEYNGSFPASLKNVVDLFYDEWHHKPVGLATVSSGVYAGSQCLQALQFVFWKIKAWTIPASLQISEVQKNYDDNGNAINKEVADKFTAPFIKELLRCVETNQKNRFKSQIV